MWYLPSAGFEPNLNKKYDEFSTRPENTQSYILKLTTGIITNIIIYIFTIVGRIFGTMLMTVEF